MAESMEAEVHTLVTCLSHRVDSFRIEANHLALHGVEISISISILCIISNTVEVAAAVSICGLGHKILVNVKICLTQRVNPPHHLLKACIAL